MSSWKRSSAILLHPRLGRKVSSESRLKRRRERRWWITGQERKATPTLLIIVNKLFPPHCDAVSSARGQTLPIKCTKWQQFALVGRATGYLPKVLRPHGRRTKG